MKTLMRKILITCLAVSMFFSCEDLTDINDNPKRTAVAPAGSLFAGAEKSIIDNLASPSVNQNIFRLLAQQWTETTYTDESNYDLTTRNIPQNWWHALYRDVLQDLREAKRIVNEDKKISAGAKANQLATAEVLEIYTWAILVDTFGDIPYTEALNVQSKPTDILQPKYDAAATIYTDLIKRLDAAIGQLNTSEEGWGSNDIIYDGDMTRWAKLANSFKLRLGMMLADVNPSLAKTTVESAAPNVFTSNADNAIFQYKAAPPNTNPVWVNLVQSGRKDFVAANTLVDVMNGLEDPRRNVYFTTVDTIAYSMYEDGEPAEGATPVATLTVFYGGIYGASNNYATYSKPGDVVIKPEAPSTLFDYSEVEFLLAEAAARGFSVTGTAAEHYTNAIRASMESWGVGEADIVAYLAQPEVAYATAEGDFRQKIGTQKWIALYNRGFEAWTEWRRLDAPTLEAPADAVSDIPLRFTYPVTEQNLNTNNYDLAVSNIGEDEVTTTLFWDVQ